jgi:CRISPR-associated endonuclease Cas1
MAATKTVYQLPQSHNFHTPRHGVVTLFGYGIQVRVDRGHLLVEDGIGAQRYRYRLPRVGHGLKRLVVIGSDGMVSLSALRWLADQDASFVMLERDGSVLTTTGPVRPSDARLRRAQALASQSGTAIQIARELIDKKLAGQERVARHKLLATESADTISRYRAELASADSPERIRQIESQAAGAYWAAWRALPIHFPRKDEPRVPEHWRVFGTRVSPLTGSPRLAANPPNAILNYLYALLESESRLAAAALGLDPGIGMLHVDAPARDSLACELMEPVRPQVDAFLLDWITREPLKREWFFEQRDGNCRLMGSFAALLSETAPTWGRAVAPFAEWVAQTLWSTTSKLKRERIPATRLTERHRSEAKGGVYTPAANLVPRPQRICRTCGATLKHGRSHCAACAGPESSKRMLDIARLGRIATHSPKAEALRAATRRRHAAALKSWQPSEHPRWLTEDVYLKQIRPALRDSTISAIASALSISLPYATDIRAGRRRPHPRHWQALAQLAGVVTGVPNRPSDLAS